MKIKHAKSAFVLQSLHPMKTAVKYADKYFPMISIDKS